MRANGILQLAWYLIFTAPRLTHHSAPCWSDHWKIYNISNNSGDDFFQKTTTTIVKQALYSRFPQVPLYRVSQAEYGPSTYNYK